MSSRPSAARARSMVKRSRALGLALTPKAERLMQDRDYPPGQHGRRRRTNQSDYAVRLLEKQRLRAQYGLREAQLRRMVPFEIAAAGAHADVLPPVPPYLSVALSDLQVAIVRNPVRAEVPITCEVSLVVEHYAR